MGSMQLVKDEYAAVVSKQLTADHNEVVGTVDGYLKVIEKLEKADKIEKLVKAIQQLVADSAGYFKDARDQPEALGIVRIDHHVCRPKQPTRRPLANCSHTSNKKSAKCHIHR